MQTSVYVNAIRSTPIPKPANRLRPTGVKADSLGQSMDLMGATMACPRNSEIFGEGEPAEYVYKVISGSVRTYKIMGDGRRQIGGFYLAGDIFGLEFADEHTLSAEAISDTKVLVIKRTALNTLAGRNVSIAQQLLALTGCELGRVQDHVMLLIKSAQERVAAFLLEMAERASESNIVELPMSRQDIADYLGLSLETVSRSLSALKTAAAIEVSTSRRIVLRNRDALTSV